jgi:pimeloyl-ACP methyl ester carboxylesterase
MNRIFSTKWAGLWGLIKSRLLARDLDSQIRHSLDVLFPQHFLDEKRADGKTNREALHERFVARRVEIPQPSLSAIQAQGSAIRNHGLSPEQIAELRDAGFKILLFTGDTDNLIPHSHSMKMKDQLNAELVLLPGVGHGLIEQVAETFNEKLKSFIMSCESN